MPKRLPPPELNAFGQLELAREILETYAAVLAKLARGLDNSLHRATQLLYDCRGSVIVSGMGKAGLIGQKIAATLASTGTRSHFLHPAEALHGDLGRVGPRDVLLVLSSSGSTEEIVRLLPALQPLGAPLLAITCRADSPLGRAADVVLDLGPLEEACPLGLAPSTSTAAMLAVGDALALVTSRMRGFAAADFARFHPGGSLGFRLSKVQDHMRPLAACRVASQRQTVRQVLIGQSRPGRRSGAIMLVDDEGRLRGLFTDSDLARLFERRRDEALDAPVGDVMTVDPCTVPVGTSMSEAVELLAARKFSELPVVDAQGRPAGLIDITDVVSPQQGAGASDGVTKRELARPA